MFQDGMDKEWDPSTVAAFVRGHVAQMGGVDAIFTFDEGGISGHPNHIGVAKGIAMLAAGGGGGGGGAGGRKEAAGEQQEAGSASGPLLSSSSTSYASPVPCYSLETVGVLRKFMGALDIPLSWAIHSMRRRDASGAAAGEGAGGGGGGGGSASTGDGASSRWPSHLLFCGGTESISAAHAAMCAHHSQYVWFRRLYLIFSRYPLVNSLKRLPIA